MVITVTLNPVMDKTITLDGVSLGEVNRVLSARQDVGGKGVNVSKVLKEIAMKKKLLPWILICVLGVTLILISLNPRKAIENEPNGTSYDGIRINSLSVYDYRPIFISSLGERRYLIENVDEINALIKMIERAEPTNLSFKDDFGKYEYQVSINEDTGEILFCFKINDEENEIFIEKRLNTNKVFKLKKVDTEQFRKIFETLEG